MPPKLSAGILLYRVDTCSAGSAALEVFLVHPGGPFWKNKDAGSWSLPKGEYTEKENPLDAAKREFREETGFAPPDVDYVPLGELRQPGGKIVTAWTVKVDKAAWALEVDGVAPPFPASFAGRVGDTASGGDSETSFAAVPIHSNTFSMEWPPKSGRMQEFPEIDRAAWFPLATAREKILPGQAGFLDRLTARIGFR